MPVYIGKSGDLVRWHRCLTHWQTSEYSATQLVSSIKHKLSHAILNGQPMVKTQLFFCGSLCQLGCTPICHRCNPAKKSEPSCLFFLEWCITIKLTNNNIDQIYQRKKSHISWLNLSSGHLLPHPNIWIVTPKVVLCTLPIKRKVRIQSKYSGYPPTLQDALFHFSKTYLQLNHILRRQLMNHLRSLS